VNSSSHSVNGDIAIQWEWSNFDPSQNSNPLTDYDKTLHNWLRPRDEHVTQNLCQSTLRERLGKYVKYKALSIFYSDFSPRLAYWSDPCTDFHAQCLKLRAITQGSAFLGSAQPSQPEYVGPTSGTRRKMHQFLFQINHNDGTNDQTFCS